MNEDPQRVGFSTFCDDVRLEANGKVIFIGVYVHKLYVPTFPYSQKMFVVSQLRFPTSAPVLSLTFKLYKDSEIIVESNAVGDIADKIRSISEPDREMMLDPEKMPPGEEPEAFTFAVLTTSINMQFTAPCVLRARFETERGVVRAGALGVYSAPQ